MSLKFLSFVPEEENSFKSCEFAYLNGYDFGDRLLEGIIFKFEVTKDGNSLEASVIPKHTDYFNTLNTEYWFEQAVRYALQTDTFYSTVDFNDPFTDNVLLLNTKIAFESQRKNEPFEITIDGERFTFEESDNLLNYDIVKFK